MEGERPSKRKGVNMPDGKGTVSVPLPANMTEDEFLKLFGTFQKARITGKQKDTATRATMKKITTAHQAEYDRIYAEEYAKAGGTA